MLDLLGMSFEFGNNLVLDQGPHQDGGAHTICQNFNRIFIVMAQGDLQGNTLFLVFFSPKIFHNFLALSIINHVFILGNHNDMLGRLMEEN
jgi:hypothetical protein